MQTLQILPNNLRHLRKLNNLTQQEIADKVFATREQYQQWEHGNAAPSYDHLLAITEVYNVTLEEILCYDIENNKELRSFPIEALNIFAKKVSKTAA